MNLDWYVFEESYLLEIDYKIAKCSLRLTIDARKSISHPDATKMKSYEDWFEEIEVSFIGVQCYKGISSLNLLKNPNDDIGSIDSMSVRELDGEDGNMSIGTYIKTLEFESDWISLQVGFNDFTINRASQD